MKIRCGVGWGRGRGFADVLFLRASVSCMQKKHWRFGTTKLGESSWFLLFLFFSSHRPTRHGPGFGYPFDRRLYRTVIIFWLSERERWSPMNFAMRRWPGEQVGNLAGAWE